MICAECLSKKSNQGNAEHQILNELLETRTELGECGPIDDAMVSADAEIDHVYRLYAVTVFSRIDIDQLCKFVCLSNGNKCSLWKKMVGME